MFSSAESYVTLQSKRAQSLPARLSSEPLRSAALEAFRQRNAALDAVFYDVGCVTPAEAELISPWLAREGALLIIPPSGQAPLALCGTLQDFDNNGGRKIDVLTVAGVGSSALGSAAFARNVADALGRPVAAVVSGYGLADLLTEALGGYYWFGGLNQLRHSFERLDASFHAEQLQGLSMTLESSIPLERYSSLDTLTVYRLLTDKRFRFSLVTGHSKGNLVLSEALGVEEVEPMAWHHTNTELPFHLPVANVFRRLFPQRASA